MRDDFAALDLFSAADTKKSGKRKKKLLGLPRRKVKKNAQKEPLAAFQPLIAKIKKKQKADAVDVASLQGWPVSLSWSAPKPEAELDASQAYPLHHSS
jgi:hypothetical protein